MPMKYMTVQEASRKWDISDRRVRYLCSNGRIRGILQQGRRYLIPENAEKPKDERVSRNKAAKERKYNDFTRLDLLKKLVKELPQEDPLTQAVGRKNFICEFASSICAQQGGDLSFEQASHMVDGQVEPDFSLAEHLDVRGVHDAWIYLFSCLKEKKTLSQNMIRAVHSLADLNHSFSRGKYRKVHVRICAGADRSISLDLIEPKLSELLNLNSRWKKEMHPIERATRFYLEFLAIHPFENADKSVAQLLLCYDLMQNGYPPLVFVQEDLDEWQQAVEEYESDRNAKRMVRLVRRKMEGKMESVLAANRAKRKRKAARRKKIAQTLQRQLPSFEQTESLRS